MDNDVFREAYREINPRFCPYEKAILTNSCGCTLAGKLCIAEREVVHCSEDGAQADCLRLLELLREQARFALKSRETRGPLPHTKAMRIQVGGLRGIQASLAPEAPAPSYIRDIRAVVTAAIAKFGSLDRLPFPGIMQQIAAYQGRRRSRHRG